jgi:hypothetical protein
MKREHRACASSYLVFTAIAGIPLVLSGVVALREPSFLEAVLVCAAALAFVFLWLSRFRLLITPEAVSYSSLFGGKRTVERSDIAEAGFAARPGAFESPLTFVIRSGSGREVRINAKVFSRTAVRELCTLET